jgi:ferredoxin--NADP+ reductase
VAIVHEFAKKPRTGKPRLLTVRFLVSPTELIAGPDGGVRAMRLAKNELYSENGELKSRATGVVEELPVDLVFRSVGYRGLPPVEGIPFDARAGVIPNVQGRVIDPATGKPVPGLYVSGWIKRGPSGVIGTNKKDGTETATAMLEDAVTAAAAALGVTDPAIIETLVRGRQPDCVTYADWARLDAIEVKLGEPHGRPRVKIVTRAAVKEALAKENHS